METLESREKRGSTAKLAAETEALKFRFGIQ